MPDDLKEVPISITKDITQRIMDSGVWDHLNELRKRIFKALISLIAGTVISFIFADKFIEILASPIGGKDKLIAIELTETISVFMRVALLSGLILSLPFILYQLLAFIMPGLLDNEKKWVYLSIPFSSIMMLSGVAFTYFIMFPTALPFLMGFMEVKTLPRIDNYISFTTNLLFWVGMSFETPLVIFVLAKLKIVSAQMLLRGWRIAIVIIAFLAALITPTGDPVNMGILMLPLLGLYLLSVLLAGIARRQPKPSSTFVG